MSETSPSILPLPELDPPPVVMTFAASDPTCGAGLQADALTCAALGVHPVTVVTGLTVQDTLGVQRFEALPADWIVDQACAVLDDLPVAAFKAGVLGSVEAVKAVAALVARYPHVPFVLDPVMASGRGDALAKDDLAQAMLRELLPHVTVFTPNLPEAQTLSRRKTRDGAAKVLLGFGCAHVLLTGTHDEGTERVVNALYGQEQPLQTFECERLPGDFHGSGCTLASAVAALLAQGESVPDAVSAALEYTWHTLAGAHRLGRGQAIPDRLFWAQSLRGAAT